MALRDKLTRPLVVDPAEGHSHTVVFLHRFPQSTTDQELRTKILSEKLTRNHKTLHEQFPTIRWVFPFCKAHARPWNNLSPEDRAAVGMTQGSLPYITQVILQEAERAGGLYKLILGGQGETAEAAHEAMSSFPEAKSNLYDDEYKMTEFIQETFHQTHIDFESLQLAAFVGMHAQDGQLTRDVKNFGMMSKEVPTQRRINTTIIKNTPHKFIRGGYKLQTNTWDGKRIDDFAEFLASIGVDRVVDDDQRQGGNESLTPKERPPAKNNRPNAKDELNDMQKHALEVVKQKKANDALKDKVLVRIEADKVERKMREERERQKRLYGGSAARPTGSVNLLGGGSSQTVSGAFPSQLTDLPDVEMPYSDYSPLEDELSEQSAFKPPRNRKDQREQGRPIGGGSPWDTQSQVRGEMSEARMAALGLTQTKDENDT